MLELYLDEPIILENRGGKTRLNINIKIGEEKELNLWYEIDSIYQEYLYTDRVDPFLVAILPYCMKKGYNVWVSEKSGVSADLLYQITEIMMPSVAASNAYDFKNISIKATPIYKSLKKGSGIATGISRGVDSFYTILNNLNGLFPLTSLTLFNVQGFGEFGGEAARRYFYREVEKAKKICSELNREYGTEMRFITVDSNIQDMLPIEIMFAGSYRDAGAIILLKQMFSLYYFAADVRLEDFDLGNGIRRENPWIFYCLSTENCRIQLYGSEASRIDKVKYISEHPITYENLRVCLQPLVYGNKDQEYQSHTNCTYYCDKCRYTVMELAAVNKLEKYKKVFDLKLVEEKYEDILAESVAKKNILQPHWGVVYKAFRQKGEINDLFEQKVLESYGDYDVDLINHNQRILNIMDCYLQRIQMKPSLKEQLIQMGCQTVAIYGIGRLGKLLYRELQDMVVYEIDKNSKTAYGNVPIKCLDEEFPPVDLVVITTVYGSDAIKNIIYKKILCKVMTLAELLNLN